MAWNWHGQSPRVIAQNWDKLTPDQRLEVIRYIRDHHGASGVQEFNYMVSGFEEERNKPDKPSSGEQWGTSIGGAAATGAGGALGAAAVNYATKPETNTNGTTTTTPSSGPSSNATPSQSPAPSTQGNGATAQTSDPSYFEASTWWNDNPTAAQAGGAEGGAAEGAQAADTGGEFSGSGSSGGSYQSGGYSGTDGMMHGADGSTWTQTGSSADGSGLWTNTETGQTATGSEVAGGEGAGGYADYLGYLGQAAALYNAYQLYQDGHEERAALTAASAFNPYIAAGMGAYNTYEQQTSRGSRTGTGRQAAAGASSGAAMGSAFGPVGTVVGAILGGVAGYAHGATASRKGENQMRRDAIRSWLRDNRQNFYEPDVNGDPNWNIRLANGQTFDIGKDGGAHLINSDGTERNYYDFDMSRAETDQNYLHTTQSGQALADVLAGLYGRDSEEFGGYFTNAAASSGDQRQNMRSFFDRAGGRDVAYNAVVQHYLARAKDPELSDEERAQMAEERDMKLAAIDYEYGVKNEGDKRPDWAAIQTNYNEQSKPKEDDKKIKGLMAAGGYRA